jgi:hypothetical protein
MRVAREHQLLEFEGVRLQLEEGRFRVGPLGFPADLHIASRFLLSGSPRSEWLKPHPRFCKGQIESRHRLLRARRVSVSYPVEMLK